MERKGIGKYLNPSTIAAFAGTVWAAIVSIQHLVLCKLNVSHLFVPDLLRQIEFLPTLTLHGSFSLDGELPEYLDILVKLPDTIGVRVEMEQSTKEELHKTTLTFLRSDLRSVTDFLRTLEPIKEEIGDKIGNAKEDYSNLSGGNPIG